MPGPSRGMSFHFRAVTAWVSVDITAARLFELCAGEGGKHEDGGPVWREKGECSCRIKVSATSANFPQPSQLLPAPGGTHASQNSARPSAGFPPRGLTLPLLFLLSIMAVGKVSRRRLGCGAAQLIDWHANVEQAFVQGQEGYQEEGR